jgi:alkylhydroperoxidase/carboxymuconolactone decarboxylase family protein YurZ
LNCLFQNRIISIFSCIFLFIKDKTLNLSFQVVTLDGKKERMNTMNDQKSAVSNAFQTFMTEAPRHSQAWMAAVQGLDQASALDKKTEELAYLSVLAALRMESGVPFHVQSAKQAGASRDEVISAVLVGLPAAGLGVIHVLPAAITAYDA